MNLVSILLIIFYIFLVIVEKGLADSSAVCNTRFLELIDLCSMLDSSAIDLKLSLSWKFDPPQKIEWLENICRNSIKVSKCLDEVENKLPGTCYNSINYIKYLVILKHSEETYMLCDNNAQALKKLIPNNGLNDYNRISLPFESGCRDRLYTNIISLQSKAEVCKEIELNRKCYEKIKSGRFKNPNVNGLRLELGQRLMIRLNCTNTS